MKKKLDFVLFCVTSILMMALVVIGIASRFTGVPVSIAGHGLTTIVSESMEPTIMTDAYATFKIVDSMDDIKEGDVILFHNRDFGFGDNAIFCHRVVDVQQGHVLTKGDNNEIADPCMTQEADIIGRVTHVWNGIGPLRPRQVMLISMLALLAAFGITEYAHKTHSSCGSRFVTVEPHENKIRQK